MESAGAAKSGRTQSSLARPAWRGAKVGPKSVVAAKSGVINDLEGNQQYMGYPAIPASEAKRQIVAVKLPDLAKRVRELEKRLDSQPTKPSDEA